MVTGQRPSAHRFLPEMLKRKTQKALLVLNLSHPCNCVGIISVKRAVCRNFFWFVCIYYGFLFVKLLVLCPQVSSNCGRSSSSLHPSSISREVSVEAARNNQPVQFHHITAKQSRNISSRMCNSVFLKSLL